MTILASHIQDALGERFKVDREIGRGGMAFVYLAHDTENDRPVAIKVLRPDLIDSSSAGRFLREIRIEGRLQHPNILPIYESGSAAEFLYYVMPFVQGESLSARLHRNGPLELDEAIRIAREVADALATAHGVGVLHRDVKPENILLSGGHAVLADFGVARAVAESAGDTLTASGMIVGTPTYMSPEQAGGKGVIDERSDVYSLGCVLYEMLAGEPPYSGRSAAAVIARHCAEPIPSLSVVRPGVPEEIEALISTALAKVPADRFRDARDMLEALDECAAVVTERTPGRPWSGRAWARGSGSRYRKRGQHVAASAIAALGAAALLGWAGWSFFGPSDPQLDPRKVVVYPAASRAGDDPDGEGIDLLIGMALDHAEPLRWFPGWNWLSPAQRANAGGLSQREYRNASRQLQAGFYITSQILKRPDSISVILQLHDTRGDSIVHQASASGALGVASYSDIAMRAVRMLLPMMVDPGRQVDLRLITDRSPAAIAHWIQGERHYRLSRFDEALASYQRALDEDSLMAFAALKGAQAANWSHHIEQTPALIEHAMRIRDALPVRYQLLLDGLHLYETGAADSALGRLRAAYAMNEQWPEVSMLMGEVHMHLLPRRASTDSAIAHFQRAAQDPGFTPPLIHLAQQAIREGRLLDAQQYHQRLSDNGAAEEILRILGTMSRCVQRGPREAGFVALARTDPKLVYEVSMMLAPGAQQVACAREGFEALLTTDAWSTNYSWGAAQALQGLLVAEGRVDEATAFLTSLLQSADHAENPVLRTTGTAVQFLAALDALAGAPMPALNERMEQDARERFGTGYERIQGLNGPYILAQWHAHNRDSGTVVRLRDHLVELGNQEGYPEKADAHARAAALMAQLQLMQGDSTGALANLERMNTITTRTAVQNNMFASLAPDRLHLARLHLALGNYRTAHDVAAVFDHPGPTVFLAFVPASLEIRYMAARSLGDAALTERYARRLRALGRQDLIVPH